jgi:hypothetical protein
MKKLLNFLLVRRSETENKWWHRLFSVLLFGSALVVLVFAVLLNVDSSDHTWVTYKPVAFSLEQNYQTAKGKELPCKESLDFSGDIDTRLLIKCDGVDISPADSLRYEGLYKIADTNLQIQFGVQKYFDNSYYNCPIPSVPKPIGYKLTPSDISCIRDEMSRISADEATDPAYTQYQEALKNLAHIKVIRDTNFGLILADIGLWVIVPILAATLWVIFWSAIIYRSILYIIFGKKK